MRNAKPKENTSTRKERDGQERGWEAAGCMGVEKGVGRAGNRDSVV